LYDFVIFDPYLLDYWLLNGKSQIFKMAWRSNRKNQKSLGVLPKGILTPSLIEIAPAVTKRALLTDDNKRHVITVAHQR
jgi:hypothetical protein